MLQIVYADLLDRATTNAFAEAFPADGAFTAKESRGRRYWYFQTSKANGRGQQDRGRSIAPAASQCCGRIVRLSSRWRGRNICANRLGPSRTWR
jgi:hypothetical protein